MSFYDDLLPRTPQHINQPQAPIEEGQPKRSFKLPFRLSSIKLPKFHFTRRNIPVILLTLIVVISGTLVLRWRFNADVTPGAFTVSGTIYAKDTKAPLEGVGLILSSSTNPDAAPTSVKTDASGNYSLTSPDGTYTNLQITKDNYWDVDAIISNYDASGRFSLNLDLKPGFGREDAQIFVPRQDFNNKFGISLEPFDNSPASLKVITPKGSTYSSSSIATAFLYYNQASGDFESYDKTKASIEFQMSEVVRIANACKTYAGAKEINRINETHFLPLSQMQTENDLLINGQMPVCNKTDLPSSQKTQTSGNYPKLPSGYEYSFTDANNDIDTTLPDIGRFVAVKESSSDTGIYCTLDGCTKFGAWQTDKTFYDKTKANIEFQMSEVVRIANACKTYAGAKEINRINETHFLPISQMQTENDLLTNGQMPVCNKSDLTGSQKTQTSGNYPKLPSGYEYSFTDANNDIDTTLPDIGRFVAIKESSSDTGIYCTLDGCTKFGAWQTDKSLFRGQVLSLVNNAWSWDPAPYAIALRGRAKTDPIEIKAHANKQVYMANPYMHSIKLSDFTVKDVGNQYPLKTAAENQYIDNDIKLASPFGDNSFAAKTDNLNAIFPPGEVVQLQVLDQNFTLTPSHPLTIKGKVTDEKSNPIADANLVFNSDDPNFKDTLQIKTDASGDYSTVLNDLSFDSISVSKKGYCSNQIQIINNYKSIIIANTKLQSGRSCAQRTNLIPLEKGKESTFAFPSNIKLDQITKTTESGQTSPVTDTIQSFEQNQGSFIPIEPNKLLLSNAGQMETEYTGNTASYSPDDNNIYIFGGKDKSTGKITSDITEFNYESDQAVGQLPMPLYNAASITIPKSQTELASDFILLIGGQTSDSQKSNLIYLFRPSDGSVIPLDTITPADRFQALITNNNLYIFASSSASVSAYSLPIDRLGKEIIGHSCVDGSSCNLGLFNNPVFTTDKITGGFIPFSPINSDKIYFLGGRASDGMIKNSIYSINSDLNSQSFQQASQTLSYPIADPAFLVDPDGKTIYLLGGTKEGTVPTTDTMAASFDGSTISTTKLDFSLSDPVSNVSFAQNSINEVFIFSYTSITDGTSATVRYIQVVSPKASFKPGQIYKMTPTSDYTLSISSSATFSARSATKNTFYLDKPGNIYYLTTTGNEPESLRYYNVYNEGKKYNLISAAKNNIIEPTVSINDDKIDLTTIDPNKLMNYYIYPGDIFQFTDKADSDFVQNDDDNDYAAYAYDAVSQLYNDLSNAGLPDEIILDILGQLDGCLPGFFSVDAGEAERQACRDSIDLDYNNPDPYSIAMNSKNTKIADLVNNFFQKAKAATPGIKFTSPKDIKVIIAGVEIKSAAQFKVAQRYQQRFVPYIKMSQYNIHRPSRTQIDRMTKSARKKYEESAWWMPFYIQRLRTQDMGQLRQIQANYKDTKWNLKKNAAGYRNNPFFQKSLWPAKDLDYIYINQWSDLAGNRGNQSFTGKEIARLTEVYNDSLKKSTASLAASLISGHDLPLVDTTFDDLTAFMVAKDLVVGGVKIGFKILDSKLPSTKLTITSTSPSGKVFGNIEPTAWGIAKQTASKIKTKIKPPDTVPVPHLDNPITRDRGLIVNGNYTLNIDKMANNFAFGSKKGTIKVAKNTIIGMDNLVNSDVFPILSKNFIDDDVTKDWIVRHLIDNNLKVKTFGDYIMDKGVVKGIKEYCQGISYCYDGASIEMNGILSKYSPKTIQQIAGHETGHAFTETGAIPVNNPRFIFPKAGMIKDLSLFEEAEMDAFLFGSDVAKTKWYKDEFIAINNEIHKAYMRITGCTQRQAELYFGDVTLNVGWLDGINTAFNDAARRTITADGRPLIGANENLSAKVYQILYKGQVQDASRVGLKPTELEVRNWVNAQNMVGKIFQMIGR